MIILKNNRALTYLDDDVMRKLLLFLSMSLIPFSAVSVYGELPTDPTFTAAIPANSMIELVWQNPINDGGMRISDYYVARMADNESAFREMPFSSSPNSYWKFDGPATGLVDYGNNHRNLFLAQGSATYADDNDGEIGQSLDLQGDTYLQLDNGLDYGFDQYSEFSISFWIQGSGQGNPKIISKRDGAGPGWAVTWETYNRPQFFFANQHNSNELRVIGTQVQSSTQWVHVVITYDGTIPDQSGRVKMYVNGLPANTQTTHMSLDGSISNIHPLTIGADASGAKKFVGKLDEIRLFDEVLTQAQAADLHNTGLVSGTTFSDISAESNRSYEYKVSSLDQNGESFDSRRVPPIMPTVEFVDSPYYLYHSAMIRVTDTDANLDPAAVDRTPITISSQPDPASGPVAITFDLIETDPDSGVFESQKLLLFSTLQSDSSIPIIQVSPEGNAVTASYSGILDVSVPVLIVQGGAMPGGIASSNTVKLECNNPSQSDDDNICDEWEDGTLRIPYGNAVYSISCGADGSFCPSMFSEDIYVEVDWLAGHRPNAAAMDAVKQSFADKGITLHVLLDDEIPMHYDLIPLYFDVTSPEFIPSFFTLKQNYFGTEEERSSEFKEDLLTAKRQVFHYAMFVHSIMDNPPASGWGEIAAVPTDPSLTRGGNDFIISLGALPDSVGSPDHQAGTFMHELGHNLGLQHGGQDSINCKPNYLSIMSYARQFSEIIPDRQLAYSSGTMSPFDETSSINEIFGIGSGTSGMTTYGGMDQNNHPLTIQIISTGTPTDFNRNGNNNDMLPANTQNIHYFDISGCDDTELRTLVDYDDWNDIKYEFRDTSYFADGISLDYEASGSSFHEISYSDIQKIQTEKLRAIRNAVNGGN